MFDFVSKRRWFFILSTVIILAGIISLAVPGGLQLGADFKTGTSFTLKPSVSIEEVKAKLVEIGHESATVRDLEEGEYLLINTRELNPDDLDAMEEALGEVGTVEQRGLITAVIASETVRNAVIAVAVASIVILFYITWAFRRMPNPFRYGTCAIVALLHDVLIVLTVFSFLGRAFGWELDPMFITAALAVIGYSVNDTIVVFDRLRENVLKGSSQNINFAYAVNASISQTLGRSLNTAITTLLAVLAVYLFVGGTIQTFVLALIVGIIAGTYSSIFIAAQLLVVWEKGGLLIHMPLLRRLSKQYRRGATVAASRIQAA